MTRTQRIIAVAVGAFALIAVGYAIPPHQSRAPTTAPVATVPPPTKDVRKLSFKNGTLKVGMTSDEFVEVVPANAVVDQHVSADPDYPSSLFVWKVAQFEGQKFTVFLARLGGEGPYKVIQIQLEDPPKEGDPPAIDGPPTPLRHAHEPSLSDLSEAKRVAAAVTICDLAMTDFAKRLAGQGDASQLGRYKAAVRAEAECRGAYLHLGELPHSELTEVCREEVSTRRFAAQQAVTLFGDTVTPAKVSKLQMAIDDVPAAALACATALKSAQSGS